MKSISIVFLSLIIAALAFGEEPASTAREFRAPGERAPIPAEGFDDVTALQKWASKSSYGGGWAKKIEIKDKEIYYSLRSVTWGIPTHELIFWTKTQGRFVPCFIVPLHIAEYRLERDGDDIVVKCGFDKGSEEVLRLKASFFAKRLYLAQPYSTQIVPAQIAPGTIIWKKEANQQPEPTRMDDSPAK